ncbi:MAG: hypothetical protein GX119_07060 [Syntrophomonadaceae bacterium]|jgi:predicted RNase H-related nuclease YkuK (DUF458 family)|nr:hypothetical protein [Syntrophomonadaceae bacterium]
MALGEPWNSLYDTESFRFYNSTERRGMTFDQVYGKIVDFIRRDTQNEYVLGVGSDSHEYKDYICFVTAVHIHRVGKGAWYCIRKHIIPRVKMSLFEKISMESHLTYLTAEKIIKDELEEFLDVSQKGFKFEVHLDIGEKGKTKSLIPAMTGYMKNLGLVDIIIKPNSYVASTCADRNTKVL